MPSFSQSLEQALHRALEYANERSHEYATLEHLLLALLDDSDAAGVMRACNADIEKSQQQVFERRIFVAALVCGFKCAMQGAFQALRERWQGLPTLSP